MKITIIGAGNIGKTLGEKWIQAGHQITYGVRNPADPKHAGLNTAPIKESLAQAEVILLALPGTAVEEFANQFGADLNEKIVIDSTNNPRNSVVNNLAVLQSTAPGSRIVHAFRTLGWENFANPLLGGQQIDLFFAGDPSTRTITEQLIQEVGLHPVYFGGYDAIPAIDGMMRAWFALAFGQGKGRRVAFKLLTD